MISRSVFLVFLSFIISQCNPQEQCPSGQYFEVDKCRACGLCYDMWMDKIKPFKSNFLNIRTLEKDISDIENRLQNNAARLAMLRKSKSELLSQLKHMQSIGNDFSKDMYSAATANNKWAEKIKLDSESIRFLEKDMEKLKRESETKPATDNSGYFRQIDKAKTDTRGAIGRAKLAMQNIIDAEKKCDVLEDKGISETLRDRVNEEQGVLSNLQKQIEDSFSTMHTEIPCENKLCALKTTCRVCNDLKKCYDDDMLKIMVDVVNRKFEILESKAKSNIPSLEYEVNQIENQKGLIAAVLNQTKSPEKHIVNRIKKILSHFSHGDIDIYKTILQLKISNKESDIKVLANMLNVIIDEWMKLHSDDINDLKDKSDKLLSSLEIIKNNVKYISETITIVKNILRGKFENNTEEQNHMKDFLMELSEILNEIDRRYNKILKKKTHVETKLNNLEQLNWTVDHIFGEILNLSHKAKKESIDINIKVDHILREITSTLDISGKLEERTKSIDKFSVRMDELLLKSNDLVNKILEFDYMQGKHVVFLETNIKESLKQMETAIEIARNKSTVYEKCA